MSGLSPEAVQQILNQSRVLGHVRRVVFLGEGEFTSAWLANDESVCRFPKHTDAVNSLKREACLLPRIASGLPLAIPQPSCYELPVEPHTVAIHPLITGQAFTRDVFESLDEAGQDRCAGQVAGFLSCVHKVDPGLAQSCGVKRANYQSRYGDVRECAAQYLASQLSSADYEYVRRLIDEFLAAEGVGLKDYRLLHGDLSPDHVLWNQEDVVGILDFGDMEIGDVAWDLVYMWQDYGPEFLRRFIQHFPTLDAESLLRRAYRFGELDAVEWAANISAGTREGDGQESLEGIRRLRAKESEAPWRRVLR